MSFQANAIPVGSEAYVLFYTILINLFTYTTHPPSSILPAGLRHSVTPGVLGPETGTGVDVPQRRVPEQIPQIQSEDHCRPVRNGRFCLLKAPGSVRQVSVPDRRVTRDISKRSKEEVKKLGSPGVAPV